MSTGTIGSINEIEAAVWLMDQKYVVCRNIAPNGLYDLIAANNEGTEIYLIDVKGLPNNATLKKYPNYVSIIGRTSEDGFWWARKTNMSDLGGDDER